MPIALLTAATLCALVATSEVARRLGVRSARTSALAFAVVALLGAAVASHDPTGLFLVLGVDVGIVAVFVGLYLPLLRLGRLARELERTKSRAVADQVIAFANRRRHPGVRLAAAIGLARADFWRDADRVLGTIDRAGRLVPMILLQTAMAKIALGELDSARAQLVQIPRPMHASAATLERIVEARILAQEGRGADALALLGPAVPADPAVARYARVVRAHALAATGDRETARAVLRELGGREIARTASSNGPAAPIAAELVAGNATPYR